MYICIDLVGDLTLQNVISTSSDLEAAKTFTLKSLQSATADINYKSIPLVYPDNMLWEETANRLEKKAGLH